MFKGLNFGHSFFIGKVQTDIKMGPEDNDYENSRQYSEHGIGEKL